MKTLGISIARDRLSALLLERTLFATRLEFACDVACREPYGSADDIRGLAAAIRERAGADALPPAALSLPAAWTYVRPVELPVNDLARAKEMHVAELDGILPIEGEEILSDVLPSSSADSGRFLAIAARKSAVEKTVSSFADAGLPIGRVATDHISLFAALRAGGRAGDGLAVSTLADLLVLRFQGGALTAARQFPAAMGERGDEFLREWREIAEGAPVTVVGAPPRALADDLRGASVYRPPELVEDAYVLALGAAMLSLDDGPAGAFSLRTSAETETSMARQRRLGRIAAASAAVAVVSALLALQAAQWAAARKVSVIEAETRKELQQAAPGIRSVVNPAAQIRSRIQTLSREQKELGAGGAGLSALLGKVSTALPAKEKISVREVSFDSGRLRLAGDAESAGLIESYRSALAAALGPGSAVTVESTQGSARGGVVGYVILIDTEARSRASRS